jgi:hypothetical protein
MPPRPLCLSAITLSLSLVLACKQTEPAPEPAAASAEVTERAPLIAAQPSPGGASSASGATRPTGTVRVVSADASKLQRPTTAAFRGDTAWIAIGQLSALFSDGGKPTLPFSALSLSPADGRFGAEVIELPGADYYPEGIAAASDGTLYIGSIMQGVITKVAPGSTKAEAFVSKAGVRRGVIGLTVDAARQVLWFCDANPKLEEAKKAGELVGVKLANGEEVVRHPLSKAGDKAPFCNDVIVSPDGTLWITESAGGRVFRVAGDAALEANSAKEWLSGGEIGPPPDGGSGANGLEYIEGALIVANVGRGTLVKVDPASEHPEQSAQTIELRDGTGQPVTLCNPDGVERVPGSKNRLLVVENGGCLAKAPRVVEVTL